MKIRTALLLLAFFAFSPAFAESVAAPLDTPAWGEHYAVSLGLAAVILAISIFLTGMAYMLGNFLMNEKIKGWAKAEAVEIFYSGVIFAFIVGFVITGTQVAEAMTRYIDPYGASVACDQFSLISQYQKDSGFQYLPCHMKVAKNFLTSIFYETAGFVKEVGVTHSWYTYLASFGIDFNMAGTTTFFSGGSFSHSFLGFMNAKNNALAFMFDNGVKILLLIRFQEVLVAFVGIALFPLLLSAGLVLRSFMITRKLGGLLLATALGLYFIFPMFYILGDSLYNGVSLAAYGMRDPATAPIMAKTLIDFNSMPGTLNALSAEDFTLKTNEEGISMAFLDQVGFMTNQSGCAEGNKFAEENAGLGADKNAVSGLLGNFQTSNALLEGWLQSLYGKGATYNPASFDSILVGMDVLAKALFFSATFSLFSIFATIAGIKGLSPILGGDSEIAGLTYLI